MQQSGRCCSVPGQEERNARARERGERNTRESVQNEERVCPASGRRAVVYKAPCERAGARAGEYVQRKHVPAHGASSMARRPCDRAWSGQMICTGSMHSMYRAYEVAIQYIQARERTERKRGNGKRAGEGVGARMGDAGARRSVGRQRAWLRVTG